MKTTFMFKLYRDSDTELIEISPEQFDGINVKWNEGLLGTVREMTLTDEGYLVVEVNVEDQELWEDLRAQVDMGMSVGR